MLLVASITAVFTVACSFSFSLGLFGRKSGSNNAKDEKKSEREAPATNIASINSNSPAAPASSSNSNSGPGEDEEADQKKAEQLKQRAKSGQSQRLIPKADLEKSKRELRTLLLEKELVSGALTRLYEAEAAGDITKDEREMLSVRYRDELKTLDERIQKIDALIEVGDLETLRDQLLQLVSQKIDAIERRIERTKIAAQPMINEILEKNSAALKPPVQKSQESAETKPQIPDISDLLQPAPASASASGSSPAATTTAPVVENSAADNSVNQATAEAALPKSKSPAESNSAKSGSESASGGGVAPKRKVGTTDGQVEELQKELLEALDRLEKLDVET